MKYKYKTLQEQARENNNKILFILCQVVWRGGWNTFLLNVFNSMGYLRWGAKLFHAKEPEKEKLILKIAILVLQMLLICVCHFSCSSTVTPSSQCFETCSPGMVSDFRFKGSWGVFWCFCLIAISMHFVFFGFGAIWFLQHHPQRERVCVTLLLCVVQRTRLWDSNLAAISWSTVQHLNQSPLKPSDPETESFYSLNWFHCQSNLFTSYVVVFVLFFGG